MVKDTKKLDSMFFSKKNLKKNRKENRGEIFCTFADMASLYLNSTFLNSDQNPTKLCARPLSTKIFIKSTKICHKNQGKVLASGPL